MATHNAASQMLGYLYQVRYALNLLMDSDDPNYQISIEKYDDIAFDECGEPKQLIQLKHHTSPASLSDSSTDLWRTLNSWIDTLSSNYSLVDHTDFIIITTANVPEYSAANAIQGRDFARAFELLKSIAEKKSSKTNAKFYEKFNQTNDILLQKLIDRIKIISSADNIVDMENSIRKQIRYACKPEHVSIATERLEGWWYQECIKALSSYNPVFTTQRQLQSKIFEITRQYDDDNLPIEFWDLDPIEEDALNPKDRIFLDQLRILQFQNNMLRLALRDYYRASMQRSSWLRQGLVYVNELESYEHRLKDEWEYAFAEMEDNIQEYGTPTDQEKIKQGKSLYNRVMHQDIRIRQNVDASYVMHGTYHHLANSLSVGWHVDFSKKLRHLLKGDIQS